MAENRPAVEASKVPEFKPRGFRARVEQFVNRVGHFFSGAEKLDAVAELTPKPAEAPVEADNRGGFMERLGRRVDGAAERLTDGVRESYGAVAEKVGAAGEKLRSTGEEIKKRRTELGIGGTARSYAEDLVDQVTAVESRVKARWESAKVSEYADQREKINARYMTPAEKKALIDAGGTVPKDVFKNREELREALRPLREAELASRREARELREVAKECYRRVEKKQNAKDVLSRARKSENLRRENELKKAFGKLPDSERQQYSNTAANLAAKDKAKQGD